MIKSNNLPVCNVVQKTTNILSRIIRRAVGDDAYPGFPRAALFGPLGMRSALMEPDASGTFVGSSFIQQFNVQGHAPSSFFYKKVVSSTISTINVGIPLPIGTNVMCEGGKDLGSGDGSVVPCAGAPRIYAGRPTPSMLGPKKGQK